jgi:agmatine deiminase
MMNNYELRLPSSWAPQDAILLVWPDKTISWQVDIEALDELYEALVAVLVDYVDIILVVPEGQVDSVKAKLVSMGVPVEYVYFYETLEGQAADNLQNSTGLQQSINVKDFGPFILESESGFTVLHGTDRCFTENLLSQNAFPCAHTEKVDIYFSWSDIESNDEELILLDLNQLLQKNPSHTEAGIKNFLLQNTNAVQFLNVEKNSTTPGTVRFGVLNQILCVRCDDAMSAYYQSSEMRYEALGAANRKLDEPLELISLPWGVFVTDEGLECVADYSQFVVVNETVLVPIFDLPTDDEALEIISWAFPGFDIFGFPSRSLAQINTGLFRITQPVPEGVLEPL